MRVALTGLTMAEYFRDHEKQNVLLFIDNIFRYIQAGSEVSSLMGRMPSAVGYQPTLANEMGASAGADYLHQGRRHHLRAGCLRPRRRPDGPGSRHHVCPFGRHYRPLPQNCGDGHLSGSGPAGVHLPYSGAGHRGRAPLQGRTRGAGTCSGTASCRISLRFWVWRSFRRPTG